MPCVGDVVHYRTRQACPNFFTLAIICSTLGIQIAKYHHFIVYLQNFISAKICKLSWIIKCLNNIILSRYADFPFYFWEAIPSPTSTGQEKFDKRLYQYLYSNLIWHQMNPNVKRARKYYSYLFIVLKWYSISWNNIYFRFILGLQDI